MRRIRDPSPSREVSGKVAGTQGSSDDSLPDRHHPVDKGWAWIIMIGVFVIHFFTTGYLRSFGLLFVEFQNRFQSSSTITATMSGVQMLAYSLGTFVTMNVLMRFISVKTSCVLGCCLELVSVVGNCLVTDVKQLIFTHGVLFGIGQALMYCPAMVILSEYFDKRRPMATVFATGGVSAGGIAMPFLIRHLVDTYGLIGGVLLTGGAIFQQAVFVSFFTSPSEYGPAEGRNSRSPTPTSLEPASNGNGKHVHLTQFMGDNRISNHRGAYASGSANDTPARYSHQPQDCTPISQTPLAKDDAENIISDNHFSNSVSHECDGKYLGQESSLYSKMDSAVPEAETESHTLLLVPENSQTVHSDPRNKQSMLSAGTNDFLHSSKSSINSALSATHSDCHSRSGQDRLKASRTHLHSLGLPSDTLIRAMSTSSVDVLGSARPLSHSSSALSFRRRGRGSSVDRATESYYERRRQLSGPRLRLPRCQMPQMVKGPTFWLVAVYFFGGGLASVLPTVFLPPLAKSRGLDASSSPHFLVVSAVMEMLGRLVPGLVLHFGYMRPSTAVIPSMALCGVLLQMISFFNDFKSLITLSCLIGFFTGSFWAMQVLVVIEIIGMENLGQAFGFYSIVLGFGVGTGFPLAGAMVDATGTYNIPYHFFGAMYLLASLMMVLVQFTRTRHDLEPASHEDDDCFEDGNGDHDHV
ncbi:hypothetical protein EGW08_012789 [Elysia chlorotica]|uniref:Major facilitator superfamily (MFS) profile domain-containing protein n=1 Tax=Elysia chlorotica TaxID=188477 RepID=A0A433TCZ9_ELYCH|nr:hypothetical protein EGW08_012789 [Elysia chlorotica]